MPLLESIYYISQTIAVFAILASLVFVGIQVRQNTTQSKIAAAEAVHRSFAEWYFSQSNPETSKVIVKGLQDEVPLTAEERWNFSANMMTFLLSAQEAHTKWTEGTLTDDRWRVWDGIASFFFSAPGAVALWNVRGYVFSDPFQAYAQTKIDERDVVPGNAHAWQPTPASENAGDS